MPRDAAGDRILRDRGFDSRRLHQIQRDVARCDVGQQNASCCPTLQLSIAHGIDADRLRSRGYGETKPLCRRHDASCRSQHRRVELVILRRLDVAP